MQLIDLSGLVTLIQDVMYVLLSIPHEIGGMLVGENTLLYPVVVLLVIYGIYVVTSFYAIYLKEVNGIK